MLYRSGSTPGGGPVLKPGCGTSRIAQPMAMHGLDVVGLDLSVEMLNMARDKEMQLGDKESSPWPDPLERFNKL